MDNEDLTQPATSPNADLTQPLSPNADLTLPATSPNADLTQPADGAVSSVYPDAGNGEVYVKDEYGELGIISADKAGAYEPPTQEEVDYKLNDARYGDRGLETFARTGANALTLGLVDALAPQVSEHGRDYVEENQHLNEHNRGAAITGEIGGAIAQAVITGGTTLPGIAAKSLSRGKALVGIVENRAVTRAAGTTLAHAVSETGVAAGSQVVRNVNDAIAKGDPVTLEGATNGVLLTTGLGAIGGAVGGKLIAKGGLGFNTKTGEAVAQIGSAAQRGLGSAAAAVVARSADDVVREAGSVVRQYSDDIANSASRTGEDVFDVAESAPEMQKTIDNLVDQHIRGPQDVEQLRTAMSTDIAASAREADRFSTELADDVLKNPPRATPDDFDSFRSEVGAARERFAAPESSPDALHLFEKQVKGVIDNALEKKASSLEGALDGLSKLDPALQASTMAKVINAVEQAGRRLPIADGANDVLARMFTENAKSIGRNLSNEISALKSLEESNLYLNQLREIAPDLYGPRAGISGGLKYLNESNEVVQKTLSNFLTSQGEAALKMGKPLPELYDKLISHSVVSRGILKRLAADEAKNAAFQESLIGKGLKSLANLKEGDNMLNDAVNLASGWVGGTVGGWAGALVGGGIGKVFVNPLIKKAVNRALKPIAENLVNNAALREKIVKSAVNGAIGVGRAGVRLARPIATGVYNATRKDKSSEEPLRGVPGRITLNEAQKRISHVNNVMDPGTVAGAQMALLIGALRAVGNDDVADNIEKYRQQAAAYIAGKSHELFPDDSEKVVGLPHRTDNWREQRFADYVNGITNPADVIKRLNAGLATPDEMNGIKDGFPFLYNNIITNVKEGLSSAKQLPDLKYFSYIRATLGNQLIPDSLVNIQGQYSKKEADKSAENSGVQVRNGNTGKFSKRSEYDSRT